MSRGFGEGPGFYRKDFVAEPEAQAKKTWSCKHRFSGQRVAVILVESRKALNPTTLEHPLQAGN